MRPVVKPLPGAIVTYRNSNDVEITHEVQQNYDPYGCAKDPLVASIGLYCSYCENDKDIEDLEVEHISPKSRGGSLTAWENFLLCCKVCNTVKGVTILDPNVCHLPHLNNTYLSFVYDCGGRVKVNPILTGLSKQKAENLYDVLKMGRYPQTNNCPSDRDARWKNRLEAWNEATDLLRKYDGSFITPQEIVSRARDKGCWSVWFTVFRNCDDVRKALIDGFEGTCDTCFDPNNHYEPIPRNSGAVDYV